MVTMPAAAPCSSTTSASCRRRDCISWRMSSTPAVSGNATSSPATSPTGRSPWSSRSRRWTRPTTSSRLRSWATGARECPQAASSWMARVAGPVGVEHQHVGPGPQHLVEGALGDLERAVDDQPLLRRERGLRAHHLAQLGLGDLLALEGGVAAHDPDRDVGGPGEQPHDGAGERRHDRQRAGGQQRPPLGALHGHALGGELAEHERDVRQHQGHDDDRHGSGGAAEEVERLLERLGQRHGGGGRGQEPGERDADLDGGEEVVGIAGQARHERTRARPLLEPLELALAQRHQRQLGAREHGVQQHQHGDEGDLSPEPAHGHTLRGAARTAPSACGQAAAAATAVRREHDGGSAARLTVARQW